jgi:hypothetical protein
MSQETRAIYKIYKRWTTHGPIITTAMSGFSLNIPSSLLQGHPLHPWSMQPKHEHLYGCSASHIRIGESISLPPQYIMLRSQQYKTH